VGGGGFQPFQLPDLLSRLGSGPVYRINELDDQGKQSALQLHARNRGFDMPDDVANYLLKHCPRDMVSLFKILDQLDEASLSAQRKLTIPFVSTLLGALSA
jgi:DnaA family protein